MADGRKLRGRLTDAQIRQMADEGKTNSEIAAVGGTSVSAVSQRLKRLGIQANGAGNLRNADRPAKPDDAETRLLPWLPGYSIAADGVVYSEMGRRPRAIKPKLLEGKPRVQLSTPNGLRYCYVAVLVAEAWIGPRPEGHVVHYRDGNPANVAASNLSWGMPGTPKIVSDEDFVRAWQASESGREVVERTGLSLPSVRSRSSQLRRLGVPLKRLKLGRRRDEIDIEALKRLAEELGG